MKTELGKYAKDLVEKISFRAGTSHKIAWIMGFTIAIDVLGVWKDGQRVIDCREMELIPVLNDLENLVKKLREEQK